MVDSAITKFSFRYPNQSVKLDISDEIIVISVDAILIEQVIINLLENAVYHAKGMTELILRVFTLGGKVVFEVLDNGCGIPEDRIKHIFENSYGINSDIADSQKRFAGIGLCVCAAIIKAHDGDISAENRKNKGALFRFTLSKENDIHGE